MSDRKDTGGSRFLYDPFDVANARIDANERVLAERWDALEFRLKGIETRFQTAKVVFPYFAGVYFQVFTTAWMALRKSLWAFFWSSPSAEFHFLTTLTPLTLPLRSM